MGDPTHLQKRVYYKNKRPRQFGRASVCGNLETRFNRTTVPPNINVMTASVKFIKLSRTLPGIVAALILTPQFITAQDFAPAALATGSTVTSETAVVDNPDGNYDQTTDIRFISATTFQATVTGSVSTGNYSYIKTGPTTGTLTYTSNYSEQGYFETETATIFLTFTNFGVGTLTSSGTYSGNNNGNAFNGSFTSTGTFTFNGPFISNVTDSSVAEDTSTEAIPFTVGDGQTAGGGLTVTRSSSNTTLVPLANVILGGSGNNRMVTITPVPNLSGTSIITLTVSDGTYTTSDTFLLTVVAVNDAPTISDVTDKQTNQATSTGAIPFTIGDIETAAGSLTVTRASSNTTLVPVAGIVLGGSGASRNVTITPAVGQSGSAIITLTVSDGVLTASDTFLLTVAAVNSAPTISNVTDKSTNEDTATTAIPFTVGDAQTAAGSLAVTRSSSNTTLVPLANVVLSGSDSSRTVTITPAPNQFGTSTITLTVSDGALTASDTFLLTVVSVNDAPTVSNVTDRPTNEDTSTGAITFTVGDVETAAGSLTVTRASSNTTVVPLANVVLGGSGASRTVTVTPVANQTGTSLITLNVSDGSLTATDTFLLTVVAVNDAPTISDVTNKSTNEDTAITAIPFSVGDIDTDPTSLVLSAGSSNLTLVPLDRISFGGSGASRTVSIAPAANQTGTSTITLSVSDGTLSTSDTFLLTVVAVNDAPTISDVTDKSTNKATSTGAIPFSIGDAETAPGSLTVTRASSNTNLVPLANIVLGGSGASRTVMVTPAANQTGMATITLTVSDGFLNASDTFVLTVVDGKSLAGWRQTYFQNPANSGNGADLNDFDKDGIVNLLEFALGTIPNDSASSIRLVSQTEMFGGQPYLTLTVPKPPGITGITYVVEVSSSLDRWASGAGNTTVITNDSTTLKVRDNTPAIGGRRYIRLKVTNP